MRYFVYCQPDAAKMHPYILAEVVRETTDDGSSREWSVAGSLAGVNSQILTREELSEPPERARALKEWEDLDDRQFDIDTDRLNGLADVVITLPHVRRPHLYLVPNEPAIPGSSGNGSGPSDDKAN